MIEAGIGLILGFCAVVILLAYLTNPFNKWHVIRLPYRAEMRNGDLVVQDNTDRMVVRQNWFFRQFVQLKCLVHILNTRYIRSPRSYATNVSGVINDIRRHRFNPKHHLLISGDHFSPLFVRNLGVFYYPTLDARLKDNHKGWADRQTIYLQTVAYALSVFGKSGYPTTTIVQTGPFAATCVNFYAYPSDTVYAMLYALAALTGHESAAPWAYTKPSHNLQVSTQAAELLAAHQSTLATLYEHYRNYAYDQASGLVSKDVHMSGAKDITRRQSSFYDNVIFWKTTQLAMRLGVISKDEQFLRQLKARVLKTFWLVQEGYFLEDLSAEGVANKYYSSDWLIVLATGFLDPAKKSEREYFERSVAYIQREGIDKPMAIKYQNDTRAHRQFFFVRLAVASYGGDAVWSFWGMEYIKVLMRLYELTGDRAYLKHADHHISLYKRAMVRDGGFPEVYDGKGQMLQTPIYRSIRQTGWVIGFEQVLSIRNQL